MKIAMLLSGGVDSSVALRLLVDQGHEVTAFYLKIWLEDELAYLGSCPWEEDLDYARKVCDQADVPLEVISMQKEYCERVVQYTVAEAKAGRTPNPDVLCNQQIKFGQFYEKIDDSFEKVATGHYAQVEQMEDEIFILRQAPDPVKDQTYFLSQLSQKQLSRAMFPIGSYTKAEVRKLAKKYNLPNQDRKDSQGICFLGKIPFREFLKHHLEEKPGDFLDVATGKVVGRHFGFWFYTIGQRQGLGLSGGPWFVVKKDLEKNIVYLANGYEPEEVYNSIFQIGEVNWISKYNRDLISNFQFPISNEGNFSNLFVKIRHGAASHACRMEKVDSGYRVILKEPVHGVAAGQFAVFYLDDGSGKGKICLGGGVISDSN